MLSNFTQLHVHSEYSLDIGFFNIDDYIKFCYVNKVSSAVITERFNLFSSVKFYKKCLNFGIKPIIGCELFLEHDDNSFSKFLLLCKNFNGYKNLTRILSQSYLNNNIDGIPIVKRKWLPFLSDDLIAIGLSFESDIGIHLINNNYHMAVKCLKFWQKTFKDSYYLSITKFNVDIETLYVNKLVDFMSQNEVYIVLTNEVCFLKKNDFFSYRAKTLILNSENTIFFDLYSEYISNKYFKPLTEMLLLYPKITACLYNIEEIVKRCNLVFNFEKDYSPKYLLKTKQKLFSYLHQISFEKLFVKLLKVDYQKWFIYILRLKKELDIINVIGFVDYFFITSEFILWAKNNEIMVGPGRGSGAGSLIAYLLSITDVDPIKYNLLFERFLNKYRVSSPDFDIDFCIEGRDLVIDYIFNKYGTNNVAQIITFGLMAVKAVIRDIGRILGYSYIYVNKIIKLISSNFGISLKYELVKNSLLIEEYNNSYDTQAIINLSFRLENMIKNIGKHAGGLIISYKSMHGILPVYLDDNKYKFITQFDKNDSEGIGFAKFDFLGLKTLSVLSTSLDLIDSFGNVFLTYNSSTLMPFNDVRSFILLQRGDTIGIFQLESYGIKSVIQKMKPETFSDVVALIALYRPGPLQSGMLISFLNRKLNIEQIKYIHIDLKRILGETYGMLVYQEQVMLIAQIIACYDLSFADFLRSAMSKKKEKDMKIHFDEFLRGAQSRGILKTEAIDVFNLIKKFAGYGFNKAHSVGYGLMTFQSAWFKSNYNIFFFTSLLSSDMDNHDMINMFINDALYFSINILPPDINRSFHTFTMVNKYNIRYGFGAIKGVGKLVISEIICNRSVFGSYNSFFDFFYRLDMNIFSKKILESLIYAGCFDKLGALRFKLVLISNKVFDLYFDFQTSFFSNKSFMDEYFNYFIKDFNYLINYKQIEITECKSLLGDLFFLKTIYFYRYEIKAIFKLMFKSGKYFNKFFCGILDAIIFKKYGVYIYIKCFDNKKKFFFSYNRYKLFDSILKIGGFLVICFFLNNGILYELFVENFFIFRFRFVKYFDIYFANVFIFDSFFKFLNFNIIAKFFKGESYVRFFIPFKGRYKGICILKYKASYHDDIINNILKFKEIKGIKIIYTF